MAWDDLCTICGEPAKPHLKKHKFTTDEDPQLVAAPRSTPPAKVEATATGNLIASRTILRFVEVLAKKQLINADEVLFIIGGQKDESTGSDDDAGGHSGEGSSNGGAP
jgi:hypothetical protein